MTPTALLLHAAAIIERFNDKGWSFYEPECFEEVEELWRQVGKKSEHPMTSLDRNDFTKSSAFWMFVMSKNKAVAGICAKKEDLLNEPFDVYLKRVSRNQYCTEGGEIEAVSPRLVRSLRGCLIYFGGVEVCSEFRGKRGLREGFANFVRISAAIRWRFDAMYTIINKEHSRLADGYGFDERHRNAVSWVSPPPAGRNNEQIFLTTSAEGFSELVTRLKPGEL